MAGERGGGGGVVISDMVVINRVVGIFDRDLNQRFLLQDNRWKDLASKIRTRGAVVSKLTTNQLISTSSFSTIMENILIEWYGSIGDAATVEVLIEALERIGAKAIASDLRKEFLGGTASVSQGSQPTYHQSTIFKSAPEGVQEFLDNVNKKRLVIATIAPTITCQKLRDHIGNIVHFENKEQLQSGSQRLKSLVCRDIEVLQEMVAAEEVGHDAKVILLFKGDLEKTKKALEEKQEKPIMERTSVKYDEIKWSDLKQPDKIQIKKLLNSTFQSNLQMKDLESLLEEQHLVDLIKNKKPRIFNNNLPSKPAYYIERKIVGRNFISNKIFESEDKDMFVFTGVESRIKLWELLEYQDYSTSCDQIVQSSLKVRFILLDFNYHFEKICKLADEIGKPVHWLHQDEQKRLIWLRSHGSTGVIRKYITELEEVLTEDEFVTKAVETEREHTDSLSLCAISDLPGMGKSAFLGCFGRKIEKKYPDRIVIFMEASKFHRILVMSVLAEIEELPLLITNQHNKDSLGYKIVRQSGYEIKLELLVDGLDEVLSQDERKFIIKSLKVITKQFKFIRVWITTRPQLLDDDLNIPGYRLQPFDTQDQVRFLVKYWSQSWKGPEEKLTRFAKGFLHDLESQMKNKSSIAGIPLHCMLIAELYNDKVIEHLNQSASVLVNVIPDLYKLFIENRLKKYEEKYPGARLDKNEVVKTFMYQALLVVFPLIADKFEHVLNSGGVATEHLLQIGVITAHHSQQANVVVEEEEKEEQGGVTGGCSEALEYLPQVDVMQEDGGGGLSCPSSKFIHHSFAEYFAAAFVVQVLRGELALGKDQVDFLLDTVFAEGASDTGMKQLYYGHDERMSCVRVFHHRLICNFLNSQLERGLQLDKGIESVLAKKISYPWIKQVFECCVYHNFAHIIKLFDDAGAFSMYHNEIFCKRSVRLAILCSSFESLVFIGYKLKDAENDGIFGEHDIYSAVQSGKLSIVKYLVSDQGFRQKIPEMKFPELVHACVADTIGNRDSEIRERIDILELLISCGNQSRVREDQLLIYPTIHKDLERELPKTGANFQISSNMYMRAPDCVRGFLDKSCNSRILVIQTESDIITCQKITENVRVKMPVTCHSIDYLEEKLASLLSMPNRCKEEMIIVTTVKDGVVQNAINRQSLKYKTQPPGQKLIELGKDTVKWSDLTPHHKLKLWRSASMKLRVELNIEDFKNHKEVPLVRLILGRDPMLFFINKVPPPLHTYVDMEILSRRVIPSDVLNDNNSSDIFVFRELSSKPDELVDQSIGSSKDIREITTRFIELGEDNDFGKVCELSGGAPVHWLSANAAGSKWLTWVGSSGSLETIRRQLDQPQLEPQPKMQANDFVTSVLKDSDLYYEVTGYHHPVVISGFRGKSVLLGEIERRLKKEYPDRLVVSVDMKDFKKLVNEGYPESPSKKQLLEYSSRQISPVAFGRKVFTEKVLCGARLELLVDGMDKMEDDDEENKYVKHLSLIAKLFKNVRLWVTTLRYLLPKLENALETLGFSIQPLDDEELLIEYLARLKTYDRLDKERGREMAKQFLKNLQPNNAGGVISLPPVDCELIGPPFKEQALKYSDFMATDLCPPIRPPSVPIKSFAIMVQGMLDKRVVDFIEFNSPSPHLDKNHLVQKHSYLSLSILYPAAADKFNKYLDCGVITDHHVLAVGIMDKSSGPNPMFKVEYQVYAEYFVAVFIHDMLKKNKGWNDELTMFLLDTLLCTTPQPESITHHWLDMEIQCNSHSFKNKVVCSFLDTLLNGLDDHHTDSLKGHLSVDKGRACAQACVVGNFVNIFKLLDNLKVFEKHGTEIFNAELVWMSAAYCGLKLVDLVCEKYTEYSHMLVNEIRIEGMSLLHVAVQRGCFTNVSYLMAKQKFKCLVQNKEPAQVHGLVHECVGGSSEGDDAFTIYGKIRIIEYILDLDKHLLEETDNQGRTPILCRNVHPRLAGELIRLGANVEAVNNRGETVLHTTTLHMHMDVFKHIPKKGLEKIVNLKDWEGYTPVHRMVTHKDPDPRVLDCLQSAGADFNCVNLRGESVVESAVRNMRSLGIVKQLIKRGGGGAVNWSQDSKTRIIRAAKDARHTRVLDYLRSIGVVVEGVMVDLEKGAEFSSSSDTLPYKGREREVGRGNVEGSVVNSHLDISI